MANNIGLLFDPTAGLNQWGQQKSVPTVVDEYLTPQVPQLEIPKWKPGRLKTARNFVNWAINTPQEEKDKLADPFYELNKWNQGLRGLNREELDTWERENAAKTEGQLEDWKERLWKNQLFARDLGMEAFQNTPDADERDEIYKNYLLGKSITQRYGNQDNLQQLLSLTPQGKGELLNSDYKSDAELGAINKQAKEKDWWDYDLGERWDALNNQIVSQGMGGMSAGSIIGAGVSTPLFGVGSVLGGIAGAGIGGAAGIISGTLTGLLHPEDSQGISPMRRKAENEEILNKIQVADNERKKTDSQGEIDHTFANYVAAYQEGNISSQEVDSMFDEIALNGKRTTPEDEFGNTEEYDYTGSNYYSAFKDSDEFEHFSVYDKLKYIAQTETLARKYGRTNAMQILDQDMQNYVSDNQSKATWALNTGKNIFVGGAANLGMNITALGALGARIYYGEEGLANYLKGMDASGSGEKNSWFNNMQYWHKVDELNTFDTEKMEEAERNGGVSQYNNVYKPGEEGDFWSWQTLNEAVKMNKFAWSDMVKNIALSKLVQGATRLLGGTYIAPGVLATESSAISKGVNTLGSAGIMASSSLGIDAAYGMQTYNEVLNANNQRLDKVIEKNTQEEVARRIQTPQAQAEFREFVDAENARRKTRAGENNSWIPVDEKQAWQDYIAHTEKVVRQEQEEIHAEDRQQAENDAADAYALDATIEGLRMASTNGMFKSYLFDKGTLNALRLNNPYVNTTFKNGAYALGKNATWKKALGILGTNVWGGFHSNYYDDVTVGFAKGFGIQDYNNYLLSKYNPAAYGSVIDEYVNPFLAAMQEVSNASTDRRSFLDGGIGALGTFFTVSPNVAGAISHKQRMKQLAESIEKAEKNGVKTDGIHWTESMGDYINSPILQAIAEAKAATRMTQSEINRVNKAIKDNGWSLDNITEAAEALNMKAIAREGTSIIEAEDAKDREAFTLASTLLSLKNSGVVANAQVEEDKANWTKKKKASKALSTALNAMMGVDVFQAAETPYTRAMQALEDASTIDEMPFYMNNIEASEVEGNPDAEKVYRQSSMIKTFLNLDQNRNALKGMSEEEKVAFAQERLKKNAAGLLDMMNKTEELQKRFENSIGAHYHPDVAQQLIYQYALDDRWKQRFGEVEEKITGESPVTQDKDWFAKRLQKAGQENTVMAKYGSMEGWKRSQESQERRLKAAQEAHNKAVQESKKEDNPNMNMLENAIQKAMRYQMEKSAKKSLEKEQAAMDKINADKAIVEKALESNVPVILAEDILRLNPNDRLRILDDYYRNDYSKEQQDEIDRAKNMLIQDGTPMNEVMEWVMDAATLSNRIEDNMEAAKQIMDNPMGAQMMQQALISNRQKAIVDYFNDKVVAETFVDFIIDTDALLNDETLAEKARNYSTAVLNGVLKTINKTIIPLTDKDKTTLKDGIETVLNERIEKQKDTLGLDSYLRKTDKVKHTEEVVSSIDPATNTPIVSEVTEDRELSDNDRRLLDYALDYSVEKGIDIDALTAEVATDDFWNYVNERNHTDRTVETVARPVSPEYMSSLVEDVNKAYKANKEEVKAATAPKPTADTPKSVATPAVEPKGDKPKTTGDEAMSGEVANNDPFGVFNKKAEENSPFKVGDKVGYASLQWEVTSVDADGTINLKRDDPASSMTAKLSKDEISSLKKVNPIEGGNSINQEIIDNMPTFNESIIDEVSALLDKVDGLNTSKQVKSNLKDIISNLVTTKPINSIKSLQHDIVGETITMDNETAAMATKLAGITIEAKKQGGNKNKGNNNEEDKNYFPKPMSLLQTRDLDDMMKYPAWKEYIERFNIVPFLQKFSELWKKDRKTYEDVHKVQAYFIYDPEMASKIQQEMGSKYIAEKDAPVIMAIEISDNIPELKEAANSLGHELIAIRHTDNKTMKYYQPIGIMPSNQVNNDTESDLLRFTAQQMDGIRSKIDASGKDYRKQGGPYLIRYMMDPKKNDSPIKTNISEVTFSTKEGEWPENRQDTPKKGLQQLMEENSQEPIESFVKVNDAQRQEYEQAKQSGSKAKLRATRLYQAMKEAVIKKLTSVKRAKQDPDDPNWSDLIFYTVKGTKDKHPQYVFTRPIGENTPEGKEGMTLDRNSGKTIVDLLREIDAEGDTAQETIDKADELVDSNSRFWRLLNGLKELPKPTGLFNSEGIRVSDYDTRLSEYAKSVGRIIDNNFNVDKLSVKVDITEGQNGRELNIHVSSGDEVLSTLTTTLDEKVSRPEFARFMKHLILDENGNTRRGLNDSRYERVKWQVHYQDADAAKGENATEKQQNAAEKNLGDLYDDGVLMMQLTKLAYPAKSVKVNLNNAMKKIWPERKAEPDAKPSEVYESKPEDTVKAKDGLMDPDTGMSIDTTTPETIWDGLDKDVIDKIKQMISDSKSRNISTTNKNHYDILDQIWSRVTSIKYAMDSMKDRFNPESAYALPSSLLGNSADEFSRDVFNGVFDNMTDEQRKTAYEDYANSTAKNYEEVYKALKAFQARLLANGQVIIKTGNREDPGHITAKGLLNVNVRTDQGVVTKQVRVAGTLDVLAVDKQGRLHIYDFKTHHNEGFTKQDAIDKGYDRQLSMYATFLEKEYGLPVASINIIPLYTPYPTPSGKDDSGNLIKGAQKTYRKSEQSSNPNQLEVKDLNASDNTYKPFEEAFFKVEEEFDLTRLSPEQMIVSFDKMTADEKAAMVEAIEDQSQDPAGKDKVEEKDIISSEPEGTAEVNEEDAELSGLTRTRKKSIKKAAKKASMDDTINSIDDSKGVKHDIEEQQKNCGNTPK